MHGGPQPVLDLCRASQSIGETGYMSALGHSRPSHFVPVLNNVRYASDSDHSRYESELTLWAKCGLMHRSKRHLYSITSSARPLNGIGTVMPSPVAVLRLIYSSTFLACWTANST